MAENGWRWVSGAQIKPSCGGNGLEMSSVGQKGFTTVRWSFAGQEGLHFVSRFMVISRVQDFVFRQNAPRSSIGRLGRVNDHIWSGYGRIFREVQNFGAMINSMSDGLFQGVNGLFGIMLVREKYRFDTSCTIPPFFHGYNIQR